MKRYTIFCKAYTIFTICVFILGAISLGAVFRIELLLSSIALFHISYVANYFLNLAHILYLAGKGIVHRKLIITNAIIVGICIVLSIVSFCYGTIVDGTANDDLDFILGFILMFFIVILPVLFIGWLINTIYILTFKTE